MLTFITYVIFDLYGILIYKQVFKNIRCITTDITKRKCEKPTPLGVGWIA